MEKKKLLAMSGVVVLVLFTLLVAPYVTGTAVCAQDKPIKLGVLIDFTGPMAFAGPPVVDGVKMRLEEANYKVAGRTVELVIEDSATSVAITILRVYPSPSFL